MIKIMHFSDIHFDRPFDPGSLKDFSLYYEQLKRSFSALTKYINEHEIDLALAAGDLFDFDTLSSDTLNFVKREIASCPKCRFFISPGDSDPYSDTSPYAGEWPSNLHIFRSEQLEQVQLDDLNCHVYGAAVTKNITPEALADNLEPFSPNHTNLLVLHGQTEGEARNVFRLPPETLTESGFDYIALGHRHEATNPASVRNYAYCGTLTGHGFDECGNKGAFMVSLDGGKVSVKDVKFSLHSYIKLAVDISDMGYYFDANREVAEIVDRRIAEVLGVQSKKSDLSLQVLLTGHVDEKFFINPEKVALNLRNAYRPIICDRTVTIPRSPLLAGVRAGIAEEARERGCPELADRALKLLVQALYQHGKD